MELSISGPAAMTPGTLSATTPPSAPAAKDLEVQSAFQQFAAGTFYQEMLKALRSTQQKPAYFHGGRAEEIFQGQMDQLITENLAEKHGEAFAMPLFQAYHGRK